MFSLDVKITFDSEKQAKFFFKSIGPELKEEFARSTTKISQRKAILDVLIKASDKTALRASLNSLMKPLNLFNNLEELK